MGPAGLNVDFKAVVANAINNGKKLSWSLDWTCLEVAARVDSTGIVASSKVVENTGVLWDAFVTVPPD